MATDNNNNGDLGSVLQQSPWGRLSEVTSTENVLQGFGNATGGGSIGGAPSGAGGGSPFTNFGNPNASGSPLTGGSNPWAAIGTSGGSAPSGGGGTDVLTGAPSGGSAGGFSGGSQGGIDFASATDSLSFQNRILIDQYVANGPTTESTDVLSWQLTNNVVNQVSGLGSTSPVNGGGSTDGFDVNSIPSGGGGSIGGFGGGNQFGGFDPNSIGGFGGGSGGFDVSSIGSFGGGNQFGGGAIPFA
ncbi:hypothetical protein DP113_02825 [Brasilonema octagenarum UFV-E1]|uniref:Uncharacterized protein n=1 Tax=Brasilonema sennae CENA114 TaxID=415709 RepID=A0A856M777_9CYAN|nr:hypothetical protein [Brasilonema sennae]QDL06993.1 hypothetical protein DP114_02870 [Brasilonema sennae CENA114]QDL13355.1 hypothetical protein DP113_02825 [Brasilonema octagenarum UFV-E1]